MVTMDQIPRTEYRKMKRTGEHPNKNWCAPEHTRVSQCIRRRDGTLALPEPSILRLQRETERILNPR
jgi:hypothetical protein